MLIKGSCHCGNISFTLDWSPAPTQIPARACTCSFCVKHGGVWTSNPAGQLEVLLRDGRQVERYEFGTRTAQFHICKTCGAVPVVSSEIDGHLYAVVSVNAFDNVDRQLLAHSPMSLANEATAERLQRRARGWIRNVRFVDASAGG